MRFQKNPVDPAKLDVIFVAALAPQVEGDEAFLAADGVSFSVDLGQFREQVEAIEAGTVCVVTVPAAELANSTAHASRIVIQKEAIPAEEIKTPASPSTGQRTTEKH